MSKKKKKASEQLAKKGTSAVSKSSGNQIITLGDAKIGVPQSEKDTVNITFPECLLIWTKPLFTPQEILNDKGDKSQYYSVSCLWPASQFKTILGLYARGFSEIGIAKNVARGIVEGLGAGDKASLRRPDDLFDESKLEAYPFYKGTCTSRFKNIAKPLVVDVKNKPIEDVRDCGHLSTGKVSIKVYVGYNSSKGLHYYKSSLMAVRVIEAKEYNEEELAEMKHKQEEQAVLSFNANEMF